MNSGLTLANSLEGLEGNRDTLVAGLTSLELQTRKKQLKPHTNVHLATQNSATQYRKGTKFRGDKFSRFLKNLCLKNIRGGFIFVFAMKMIGDRGRIINIRGVKFSR